MSVGLCSHNLPMYMIWTVLYNTYCSLIADVCRETRVCCYVDDLCTLCLVATVYYMVNYVACVLDSCSDSLFIMVINIPL